MHSCCAAIGVPLSLTTHSNGACVAASVILHLSCIILAAAGWRPSCQQPVLTMRFSVPSQAAELGANVEGLLIAVKSTRDFEAEMAQKFGGGPSQPEPEEVCPHHTIPHAFRWASLKLHLPQRCAALYVLQAHGVTGNSGSRSLGMIEVFTACNRI